MRACRDLNCPQGVTITVARKIIMMTRRLFMGHGPVASVTASPCLVKHCRQENISRQVLAAPFRWGAWGLSLPTFLYRELKSMTIFIPVSHMD